MTDTLEARVEALEVLVRRIADAGVEALDDMNARLAKIDEQNQRVAEGLQVLGGYTNSAIEFVQDHVRDPDAHG